MVGEPANAVRSIRVFGSTRAISGNGTDIKLPRNSRNMLALLVAGGDEGLTTEQILDEVADGDRSSSSQSKVRMDLSRLRQRIGTDALPPGQGRWRVLLPVEAVDHHLLLAAPDIASLGESDLTRLLEGAPFRESSHSPLVQTAIKRARAARTRLIVDVIQSRPDLLTVGVLDSLDELAAADPFDDDLCAAVLRSHLSAGEPTRARAALSAIELAVREQLDGATPGIPADLRRAVLRAEGAGRSAGIDRPSTTTPDDPFVGRANASGALIDWMANSATPAAVITGRAGIGKSRLLDEVVDLVQSGRRIIRINGRETARSALEPWREGLPDLEPHLRSFLEEADTEELLIARARLWDAARSVVLEGADPLIVIDDAQWFDSLSLELAEFLIRTAGRELKVLVAGRPPASNDWGALHRAATQVSSVEIELAGLTRAELDELIGRLRPETRLALRAQFAAELDELCSGLPAVARPLIENARGEGLHLPSTTAGSALVPLIERLAPTTRTVALVLAVLGPDAHWDNLVELSEVSEREVLEACKELTSRKLADTVTDDQPMVGLRHVLVRDAVLEVAADADRWRLNREAASLTTSIHRRAEHEFLAYPLVRGEQSGQTLLESAASYVATGALREAISTFHRAQLRLGDTPMPIESLIEWAGSLDRLGLQGHRVRVEAVSRALQLDDAALALDAALSGLPEAEVATGDESRLGLLQSIPHDDLSPGRRFDHAHATGRQFAVLGRSAEANHWLDLAAVAAAEDGQTDTLRLARWLAEYSSRGHRERLLDDSFYPIDGTESVWTTHLRSLDSLGAGDVVKSERLCAAVRAELELQPNPYLRWHNLLIQATGAISDGRVHDGMTASNTAFEHGVRYGLRESGSAWLAQIFMAVWMQRGAGDLLDQMTMSQGEVEGSFLAEAAMTVALQDAGEFDRASSAAQTVADKAMAHESFAGCAALLLVSRVLRNDDPRSASIHERLLPLRSSLAVVGGGFACLGPVDMALGFLSGEGPDGPHFRESVDLVDRHEVRGWQIAVRLELARTFGDADRRAQATSLAAGLGWDTGNG
jgi:hypothetical protein